MADQLLPQLGRPSRRVVRWAVDATTIVAMCFAGCLGALVGVAALGAAAVAVTAVKWALIGFGAALAVCVIGMCVLVGLLKVNEETTSTPPEAAPHNKGGCDE